MIFLTLNLQNNEEADVLFAKKTFYGELSPALYFFSGF